MNSPVVLIKDFCVFLANQLGTHDFIVLGTIAIILVSLICGAVGSLVVGNRMAFFSDALAHSAFAGISLGIVTFILMGGHDDSALFDLRVPLFMIAFGSAVGVGIAFVREKTGLASDTVIGVFFAGALGIGALVFANLRLVTNRPLESILFGSTTTVKPVHLLLLIVLAAITLVVLVLRYNQFVFASFNPSLARSRRIALRLQNYLFIILLAWIVNICLLVVGIILINAMLLVPAASAQLVSRNMRQMFWRTIVISFGTAMLGLWMSLHVEPQTSVGKLQLPASGCVVVLNVFTFMAAMAFGSFIRGRQMKTA